jgi:predicted DCC family thiol-disulfide oxidoreductase YuxK
MNGSANKVSNPPPERPLLVFDGDCGFCRYWVERLRGTTRGKVDYEPSQEVAADFPEIPRGRFDEAVQLIETDGTVSSGADALFRALEIAGRWQRPLGTLRRLPGFMTISRWGYRLIARNRMTASFLTRVIFRSDAGR